MEGFLAGVIIFGMIVHHAKTRQATWLDSVLWPFSWAWGGWR